MPQLRRIYTKNAEYQKFEVLKTNRNKRYKYNEFWVEGVRNLNAAVQNGWNIHSLIYTPDKPLSRWATEMLESTPTQVNYALPAPLMAELSGKADTSELMAIVEMRRDDLGALKLSKTPLLALFDRASNKGNLGTILRSCDALGVDALLLTGHAVDLYDTDVVVSSMGSFFCVPTVRVADNDTLACYVDELRQRHPGFQLIGTTAHKQHPIDSCDLTRPTMLLIGNETDGLCAYWKEHCDVQCTIPMAEGSYASSFNVGCAATVMFYEAQRQRRAMPKE